MTTKAESHAERQARELATAQRERDEATDRAEAATLARNAITMALEHGVTDREALKRIESSTETERQRSKAVGSQFVWAHAVAAAIHEVKGTGFAPQPPAGQPSLGSGRPGKTAAEIEADRRAYKQTWDELNKRGLVNPATQTIPGDGGGLTGGPLGGK